MKAYVQCDSVYAECKTGKTNNQGSGGREVGDWRELHGG